MSIGTAMTRLGHYLLTQDCVLCASDSADKPICPDCTNNLPKIKAACPICALPSVHEQICGKCLVKPPHYDRTLAVWTYDFPIDRIVQAFKFSHRLELAPWFAEPLAKRLDLHKPLLVPMPLHNARLAERGFNQSLEIARHVAKFTGGRLLSSVVGRHRKTRLQSGLPPAARAANVRNAFQCEKVFSGEILVVVDDVMTTGATLNELARTLKRAGAAEVINLVVARTLPRREMVP